MISSTSFNIQNLTWIGLLNLQYSWVLCIMLETAYTSRSRCYLVAAMGSSSRPWYRCRDDKSARYQIFLPECIKECCATKGCIGTMMALISRTCMCAALRQYISINHDIHTLRPANSLLTYHPWTVLGTKFRQYMARFCGSIWIYSLLESY